MKDTICTSHHAAVGHNVPQSPTVRHVIPVTHCQISHSPVISCQTCHSPVISCQTCHSPVINCQTCHSPVISCQTRHSYVGLLMTVSRQTPLSQSPPKNAFVCSCHFRDKKPTYENNAPEHLNLCFKCTKSLAQCHRKPCQKRQHQQKK